jgi:hypothetical protein
MLITFVHDDRADAGQPFLQIAGDVADVVGGEGELLVRVAVHEVVAVAVGVQELHRPQLDLRLDDAIGGLEGLLQDVAGPQVAHLRLHEGGGAARRGTLKVDVDDRVRLAFQLDASSAPQFACGCHRAYLARPLIGIQFTTEGHGDYSFRADWSSSGWIRIQR